MAVILQQSMRMDSSLLGVVIPLLVFLVSFVVTWMLYRHFSKRI